MHFLYRSGIELAASIRDGTASSREIVREHLDRIHERNDELNAVVRIKEDDALRIAEERDREARRGELRGPLHGVPITIKEQFWLEGERSTMNSSMFSDWTASEDAVVVERLKRSGAVILGQTNVPKDLLDYQVSGDLYPEGKNPYDPGRSPGGSSGGSAAALASGMTPVELGGDFGGSIRNPANFCGVYGLKPTEDTIPNHGLIPKPEGAYGHVFHMAQAGPLARNVQDLELVWKIIRGPHRSDRVTPRIQWKDASERTLDDYRVAWIDRWPSYEPSPETRTRIQQLADDLSAHGCRTAPADLPADLHRRTLAVWMRLFGLIVTQDMPWPVKLLMKFDFRRRMLKGSKRFRKEYSRGFKRSFPNYSEAMGLRAGVVADWERFFDDFDLLICPMGFGPAYERRTIGTPFEVDDEALPYVDYCWPYLACFNASGHPCMNIPLGLDADGLPVGVQAVGPYWSEPVLLRFAELVSTFTAGFVKPE
ncbi:MAG: amidase [Longimicrobiales bacterium]